MGNSRDIDKTCLTYWLPKLQVAGIPVPKTIIVPMPQEAQEAVWAAFDGKEGGDTGAFFASLAQVVADVGLPCFLRTTHTSGKHDWKNTCHLRSVDDIGRHVFAIAEYSEINGMFGELPWHTWAVREFLPTMPLGHCERYGDMPLCREFRFFVEDGAIRCCHPYWPMKALEQGGAVSNAGASQDELFELLSDTNQIEAITELAQRAGRAVPGFWSIDVLETQRGWFVTDMAEGHKSFHWESCQRALPPKLEGGK